MSAAIELAVLEEYIERYSNWGRWGVSDQAGTVNLITPDLVRDAARAVRKGRTISLSLPFGSDGPQTGANGRFNCLRYSVASGTDHELGRQKWNGAGLPLQMGFADDTVVLHLQSATHWDSLCHIFHQGAMYNGRAAQEFSSTGTLHNGLEQLADKLVGRGVLLDLPRATAVDWLEDGHAIGPDELEAAAEYGRVTIRPGDILLLRTGKLARSQKEGWGSYAGGDAPGLSVRTVPWLYDREVAAVASDTWGVEVRPNEIVGSFQPFHVPAIVYMGLPLGEMFDLEELAEACEEDGAYEFLVCASPVPFVGTAGGPPAPIAIL